MDSKEINNKHKRRPEIILKKLKKLEKGNNLLKKENIVLETEVDKKIQNINNFLK